MVLLMLIIVQIYMYIPSYWWSILIWSLTTTTDIWQTPVLLFSPISSTWSKLWQWLTLVWDQSPFYSSYELSVVHPMLYMWLCLCGVHICSICVIVLMQCAVCIYVLYMWLCLCNVQCAYMFYIYVIVLEFREHFLEATSSVSFLSRFYV